MSSSSSSSPSFSLSAADLVGKLKSAATEVRKVDSFDVGVARGWLSRLWKWSGTVRSLPEFHSWDGIDGEVKVMKVRKAAKRRSMAELIAGTDLDGEMEEEEEEKESEESRRRERKKSKYLCPPYTMVDAGGRSAGSGRYDDGLKPIGKCSRIKSFVLDESSVDLGLLVSEVRFAAVDAMYLEDSSYDFVVRGFVERFRSSVYMSGAFYQDYKEWLENPGGSGGRLVDVETQACESSLFEKEGKPGGFVIVSDSENAGKKHKSIADLDSGKSKVKSTGPGRKRKSVAGDESGAAGKLNRKSPASGRKMKSTTATESNVVEKSDPMSPGFDINITFEEKTHGDVEGSGASKSKEATGRTTVFENVIIGNSNGGKSSKRGRKKKSLGPNENGPKEPRPRGRPRKNPIVNGGPIAVIPISVGPAIVPGSANGSAIANFVPGALSIPPQPAQKPPLDFVKMSLEKMITTLNEGGSQGEVGVGESTSELKPEAKGKLADEMNGLLKKVNNLLTTNATTATTDVGGVGVSDTNQ